MLAVSSHSISSLLILTVCFIIIALIFVSFSRDPRQTTVAFEFDSGWLDKIERKYGVESRQRFMQWQHLMSNGKTLTESEKLAQVNGFFNQNIRFVEDLILWLKEDYWATPTESLAKGAGDCEDFSIAKFFTLVQMGVDENKLRMTYVKALKLNQAHMVLTYFEFPDAMPLVLDNLDFKIKLANERADLLPVYSFNGSGLWLAKVKGFGQVESSNRLEAWADLKRRMLVKPF